MGQKQHKRKARRATQKSGDLAPPRTTAAVGNEPRLLTTPVIGIAIALAALVAAVYAQVRHFEFVYLDDPVYVVDNPNVRQGLSWAGVKWALTTDAAGNWHPLTWVSHMVDIELSGVNAGGHHVTSAVIHILNSVLLFAVVYRMTSGLGRSAFVAALFAIHPQHVESVAWVSERKDVLSTLFWMLTLHAYVSYARRQSVPRMLLVIVLFAGGLMSKPMLVTLPFTLLLLDYWPLRRLKPDSVTRPAAWWPLIREKLPLFAMTVFSMIVTVKVQRGYGAVVALTQLPVATRIGNSMIAYVSYIRDMVWPLNLAAYYPFQQKSGGVIAGAALVLLTVTALAVRNARSRPYIFVGWAWFIGTLVPAIGLVQVGDQARADRYTYVPAIGLLIIVAWGAVDLVSRWRSARPALWVGGGLVAAACAAITVRQVSYWKNNLSLFSRALDVTSRNYRAEALMGVALSASGRHDEAVRHYQASIAIWPGNAEARSNLGASLVALGKPDEALEQFAQAVKAKPGAALYHYNYGVMLYEKGRIAEAFAELNTAVQLDPGNKQYRDGLALLESKQKR